MPTKIEKESLTGFFFVYLNENEKNCINIDSSGKIKIKNVARIGIVRRKRLICEAVKKII